MDEADDSVLDAIIVLRSLDHRVEPNAECERWRVGDGDWIPLGAPLALAIQLGLVEGPGRAQ